MLNVGVATMVDSLPTSGDRDKLQDITDNTFYCVLYFSLQNA